MDKVSSDHSVSDSETEGDIDERPDRSPDKPRADAGSKNPQPTKSDDEDQTDADESPDDGKDGDDNGGKKKKGSRLPLLILAAVVVLGVIGGGIWWYLHRNQTNTDDAYTDGRVGHDVAAGQRLRHRPQRVNDNQFVHKGDLLIQIDPRPYDRGARPGARAACECPGPTGRSAPGAGEGQDHLPGASRTGPRPARPGARHALQAAQSRSTSGSTR